MGKIIEVYPRAGKTPHTAPVWQYDYGQIIHINGIELPASYKAEFSNTTRGDAIATVQTTDEITIPAQFLESGAAVYIWLVVVDESSRTTEYALIVPVAARAKPTDEEPTPEEQSEIDQTLAALNSGVSQVEQIADAIPGTINDALEAAKGSGEFDGEDGSSPEVTVAPIQGGHRITITDANGTHTVDILDGAKGDTGRGIVSVQKTGTAGLVDTYTITYTDNTTSTFTVTNGQNGTPGTDGTTFTPAVSAEGVISWTNDGGKTNPQTVNIKGPAGPTGATGATGPAGEDGISPTVTVTDIPGGHRITITDADGAHSFDVMDGDAADAPVQDVQMGGTSILNEGIANIPAVGASRNGYCRIDNSYGINANEYGRLYIQKATDADTKAGTNQFRPLVPYNQHFSVFYGLAKLAGVALASGSDVVGVYPDAAKVAIQKMLGIYEAPWELIREDTVTNTTSEALNITTDGNGQAFELTDIRLLIQIPTQETDFSITNYALCTSWCIEGTSRMTIALAGTNPYTLAANSSSKIALVEIESNNGMSKIGCLSIQNENGSTNAQVPAYYSLSSNYKELLLGNNAFNKITINAFTGTINYRLYGRRKWN